MKLNTPNTVLIRLLLLLLNSCAPDPRNQADAYRTTTLADQTAADQAQARVQDAEAFRQAQAERQTTEQARTWALNFFIKTMGAVLTVAVCVALAGIGTGISWAGVGIGRAAAHFAEVQANLIHLDEKARQFPLIMHYLGHAGLIVGIVVLTLAFTWRWRNPWNWGLVTGVLAWGFTGLSLLRHWFSLTKLEEVTGLDLNRDGVIGEDGPAQTKIQPENSPRVISVHLNEVKDNGHFQQVRFDLHATDEQMMALAEGLLEKQRPFTVREWCGAGRPFSGEQFAKLRAEMLQNDMLTRASEKSAQRGFVLTAAGQAVLEDFLADPNA